LCSPLKLRRDLTIFCYFYYKIFNQKITKFRLNENLVLKEHLKQQTPDKLQTAKSLASEKNKGGDISEE